MGMWEILEEGRDDYGRGFGMRGDEVEEAYKEGCRKGYEKAMREMRGEKWVSVMVEEVIQVVEAHPAWMNADTPDTFLNIRVWMKWANADADALTVNSINNRRGETPLFLN